MEASHFGASSHLVPTLEDVLLETPELIVFEASCAFDWQSRLAEQWGFSGGRAVWVATILDRWNLGGPKLLRRKERLKRRRARGTVSRRKVVAEDGVPP